LHDIGYAPELALTGFHPVDCAGTLNSAGSRLGFAAPVAHHSAARVEAEYAV
jgi:hypothetical protein